MGMHTKTKMCKFFCMQKCTRGDACTFAHTFNELKPRPDFRRTRFCLALIDNGHCDNENCTYAHSKEELRSIGGGMRQPSKRTTIPRPTSDIHTPPDTPDPMDFELVANRDEEQRESLGVDMDEALWRLTMLDTLGTLVDEMHIDGLKIGLTNVTCGPCSSIIDGVQTSKTVSEASEVGLATMPVEDTGQRCMPFMDSMQTTATASSVDSPHTYSDSDTQGQTLSSCPDDPFCTNTILCGKDDGSLQLTGRPVPRVHVPTGLCVEVKNTFLSFYSAEAPDQGPLALKRRRARSC